jgi:hypothetical protein
MSLCGSQGPGRLKTLQCCKRFPAPVARTLEQLPLMHPADRCCGGRAHAWRSLGPGLLHRCRPQLHLWRQFYGELGSQPEDPPAPLCVARPLLCLVLGKHGSLCTGVLGHAKGALKIAWLPPPEQGEARKMTCNGCVNVSRVTVEYMHAGVVLCVLCSPQDSTCLPPRCLLQAAAPETTAPRQLVIWRPCCSHRDRCRRPSLA